MKKLQFYDVICYSVLSLLLFVDCVCHRGSAAKTLTTTTTTTTKKQQLGQLDNILMPTTPTFFVKNVLISDVAISIPINKGEKKNGGNATNSVPGGATASPSSNDPVYQTRRRLFATFAQNRYDRRAPPTVGDEVLARVNMDTKMLSLELVDDAAKILAPVIYVKLTWQDSRLTWNPTEFDNITSIDVAVDELWLPSFRLLEWSFNNKRASSSRSNTRWFAATQTVSHARTRLSLNPYANPYSDQNSQDDFRNQQQQTFSSSFDTNPLRYQDVRVTNTGQITFSGFIVDEIFCPSWNIYHFPFDKQACLITLYLPNILLTSSKHATTATTSSGWTLMQMTEEQISGDWYDSSIFVGEFVLPSSVSPESTRRGGSVRQHVLFLERMPTKHIICTVVPPAALTIFHIIGCFLACEHGEMYNFSANIMTSLVLLYIGIDNDMPISSENFPIIGYYYLALLCISFAALMLAKAAHKDENSVISDLSSTRTTTDSTTNAAQSSHNRNCVLWQQQQKEEQAQHNYHNNFSRVGYSSLMVPTALRFKPMCRWFSLCTVSVALCCTTAWAYWQWSNVPWPIDREALLRGIASDAVAALPSLLVNSTITDHHHHAFHYFESYLANLF